VVGEGGDSGTLGDDNAAVFGGQTRNNASVECPAGLVESEFFGHVNGAFSFRIPDIVCRVTRTAAHRSFRIYFSNYFENRSVVALELKYFSQSPRAHFWNKT